ncbi:hypothetical protein PUN28_003786 [Cardiocondyla obscurior]|uniref:Uncharacterized protein n=1 Tax=Cardiocondyla obscurior TaxID=286306 RepID=A0AAW2GM99_9HYME
MNNTNVTIHDILLGRRSISLPLYVAGGIVIAIIICTCCCTLCIRSKCARIINKLTGRGKREPAPPDLTYVPTEVTASIIPRESQRLERLENESPTDCYKCYRKKKKRQRVKRRT